VTTGYDLGCGGLILFSWVGHFPKVIRGSGS